MSSGSMWLQPNLVLPAAHKTHGKPQVHQGRSTQEHTASLLQRSLAEQGQSAQSCIMKMVCCDKEPRLHT